MMIHYRLGSLQIAIVIILILSIGRSVSIDLVNAQISEREKMPEIKQSSLIEFSAIDGQGTSITQNGTSSSDQITFWFSIKNPNTNLTSDMATCTVTGEYLGQQKYRSTYFNCPSPVTYRGLTDGKWEFKVGNFQGQYSPRFNWQIQSDNATENLTLIAPFVREKFMPSNLTVVTNVENNCQPTTRCDDIQPEDFTVDLYEFKEHLKNPYTWIKSFPGSAEGWVFTSLPPSTQYDFRQYHESLPDNTLAKMSYSPGCQGIVGSGEIFCEIKAKLTTLLVGNGEANSTKVQ